MKLKRFSLILLILIMMLAIIPVKIGNGLLV